MKATPQDLTVPGGGRKLYRDAASLASSSMLTALLGVAFWGACARWIAPADLGVQTALLAIITAPAIVAASGIGDAFTAVIPTAEAARAAVFRHGYRLLVPLSAGLGVVGGVVTVAFLPQVHHRIVPGVLVAVGVMIWALFAVQDSALTSVGRAHWLPIENGSVSAVKILLVPACMFLGLGYPAVAATLLPCLIAVLIVYPRLRDIVGRLSAESSDIPLPGATRTFRALSYRTTTSVALSLGTLTLTPFIVTASAGGAQGATFSLCLSIVQSLDFVGAAMGVSLVVHGAPRAAEVGRMARSVFLKTLAVIASGALVLAVLGPWALRMLNPTYSSLHAGSVIALLASGSVVRSGYVIWAALQRARRNMKVLLGLNSLAAALVFSAIVPCADRWGAVGAAGVLAAAQTLLTLGAATHLLVTAHIRRRRSPLDGLEPETVLHLVGPTPEVDR